MNWLDMLRGPPGRLETVRRLSDDEVAARRADLESHGDVICAGCGWQGFARDAIFHGVFERDPATGKMSKPATSGMCVYECPCCHLVDDAPHDHGNPAPQGMMFIAGWMLLKGEWREQVCNSEHCLDRGKVYVGMGCPGCGSLTFWHTATNGPPNGHGWVTTVEGGLLTMNPSLLDTQRGCHFFIRGNQVQWC